MSEQLPPEGRLTDDQRARMRSGLLAAAGDDSGRSRPWLAPVTAAVAVGVLLAGGAIGGVVLMNRDRDPGGAGSGAVPVAGSGSSSASPSAEPGGDQSVEPTPVGSSATDSAAPDPTPGSALPPIGPCVQEVQNFLPKARDVDRILYDDVATYLFATADQWVVCDSWAMVDGGVPTVLAIHDVGAPLSKDLFLISQNYSMNPGDGAQYLAAGARPDGVAKIEYTFPTGDTVKAKMVDSMWSMVYLLPDPPRRVWSDPVVVTVTLDDGTTQRYDLTGMDLCAQVNHGC